MPNDLIDFISPVIPGSIPGHPAVGGTNRNAITAAEATLPADRSVSVTASSSTSNGSDTNEREFMQEIRARLFASVSAPCAMKRFHYEKDAQGPVGQLVGHFK